MPEKWGGRAALLRFGAPLAVGLVLTLVTGCSMPSVFGSDDSPLPLPPPLEADAEGKVPDNTGRKDGDETDTADNAEAGATAESDVTADADAAPEAGDGQASSDEYPELADVPEGAEATKSAEKAPEAQAGREQLAGALVADRAQAKYTDEELRGGRVAAVSAPRPQPAAPPRAEAAPAAEVPPASAPLIAAPPPPPAAAPLAAPHAQVAAAPVTPVAPRSIPPRAPAAPVQAAPAYSSSVFQPSTAQPLPADLAAGLPAGVAQRYQETLRKPVTAIPPLLPVTPALARPGGGAYASIPFASGSSQLSSGDRSTIAQVAGAVRGGYGRIRVVGHASSTASSQSESQRLIANWQVSQARATAVADELIRQGVDSARITIEAVGDSQQAPGATYLTSEAAARRVDLFLE